MTPLTEAAARRAIWNREYAAWRAMMEREFNVIVPSGAAEARFSRRMEAEMPGMLAEVGLLVGERKAA